MILFGLLSLNLRFETEVVLSGFSSRTVLYMNVGELHCILWRFFLRWGKEDSFMKAACYCYIFICSTSTLGDLPVIAGLGGIPTD